MKILILFLVAGVLAACSASNVEMRLAKQVDRYCVVLSDGAVNSPERCAIARRELQEFRETNGLATPEASNSASD